MLKVSMIVTLDEFDCGGVLSSSGFDFFNEHENVESIVNQIPGFEDTNCYSWYVDDQNEDGFDDEAFMSGAQSGDANSDGTLKVIDLVIFVDTILNGNN